MFAGYNEFNMKIKITDRNATINKYYTRQDESQQPHRLIKLDK